MTERNGIGAIGGQNGLGFFAPIGAHQSRTKSSETGLDAVGHELIKNSVWGERTVLADFFGQFAGFAGQGLESLGQLGFFLALDFDLFFHFDDLLGGVAFLDFGYLQLAGEALPLALDELIALGQFGHLLLESGSLFGFLAQFGLHRGQFFL